MGKVTIGCIECKYYRTETSATRRKQPLFAPCIAESVTGCATSFHLAVRAGGALRAVGFHLALGASDASNAVHFPLPVRAGLALRAVVFHLAVRAGLALRALVWQLPVRAAGALRALAFQLAVRAGVALRAAVFHLAVGAGVALRAVLFHLAMDAPVALRAVIFPLPVWAALHFQCDKRECENGHSARVYRLIAAPRRCGGWRQISDNDKIAFAATMNKTKIFTTIDSLPNALGAPRFTPSRRGLQCRFASALRGSGCERVQTHAFRAMSAVAGVTAVVSADNCKRSTFSRRRNATPAVAFPSSPGRLTGDARFPPGSVSSTRGYRSSSRNALFASNKPRSGVPGDVSVSRDESDRLSLDNIRASLIRQEGEGLSHSPHSASLNAYTRLTLSC